MVGCATGRRGMRGTMMDFPLTLTPILERAGKYFGTIEIVSRRPDRSLHRTTYAELYRRARALAKALEDAGMRRGDRVATLCWNHSEHMEAYFGVPVAGGVVHTLNLRLSPADLLSMVKQSRRRQPQIQRVHHAAGHRHPEVGLHVLRVVPAQRGHAIPAAHPRVLERLCQGSRAPVQLRV